MQHRVFHPLFHTALAISLIAGCIVVAGCERTQQTPVPDSATGVISAELKIDFGDGTNKQLTVTTNAPATVLSLLQAAAEQGEIELEFIGSGDRAFVDSLNKIANEGPGGKNWTYRVNGKLGHHSCGIANLSDKDVVDWKLGEYKPEEETE